MNPSYARSDRWLQLSVADGGSLLRTMDGVKIASQGRVERTVAGTVLIGADTAGGQI